MATRTQGLFTVTVASATTTSPAIDLQQHWDYAYLVIQSMTSNSQIHLRSSDTLTGTYRRVYHPVVNTNTIAANASFAVHSSITNAVVPLPAGIRFLQIEQTATADSGQTYKVLTSGG